MIPRSWSWPRWIDPPKLLQAGVNEHSHKRTKSHNSNHTEALCKKCHELKVRGKCRNKECK